MVNEIAVIGYPSYYGGADTELLDQIKVWNMMGITVHIIPTKKDKGDRIDLTGYNVVVHKYLEFRACTGLHTISFCNPGFLIYANLIKKYAKSTSWVNCMTFNWKYEIVAHKNGYIDFFLYQTKHQYECLAGHLLKVNKNYIPYHFVPYFDYNNFEYIDETKRNYDHLRFGRMSRCSVAKYSKNQFKIYSGCKFKKEGIVMGWQPELAKNFDIYDLAHSDCIFLKPNAISRQEFYKRCNVFSMSTHTYENLPRVGFESMASGSVLIVDDTPAWRIEVENEKTGFLCKTIDDFISAMTYLNNNPDRLAEMSRNARAKLEADFSFEKSASSWSQFFNKIDVLKN